MKSVASFFAPIDQEQNKTRPHGYAIPRAKRRHGQRNHEARQYDEKDGSVHGQDEYRGWMNKTRYLPIIINVKAKHMPSSGLSKVFFTL